MYKPDMVFELEDRIIILEFQSTYVDISDKKRFRLYTALFDQIQNKSQKDIEVHVLSTVEGEKTKYYKECETILTNTAANIYIQDMCQLVAINKKYANKKDQASMYKMQEETKLVYEKYGTSPTGGCLTSLIQLPILFALWPVIREVSKYIDKLEGVKSTSKVYNFLFYGNIVENDPSMLLKNAMKPEFNILLTLIAISIPVLAGLSQWVSMKTAQSKSANKAQEENQMMNQMNATMKIMPLFSVFMCFKMPLGLGLYWVVSAVVRWIQQVVINAILDRKPVEVMIQENAAKMEKKNSKKKVVDSKNVNSMATKYTKKIEEMKKQVYEDAEKQQEREEKAKAK